MELKDFSPVDRETLIRYLSSSMVDSTSNSNRNENEDSANLSSQVNNLDDVAQVLSIEKSDLGEHFVYIPDYHQKYTLMQFAVINGSTEIVKHLLNKKVNPNFPQDKAWDRRKKSIFPVANVQRDSKLSSDLLNCPYNPVLLAAQFGQHEILRLFKYHPTSPEHTKRYKSEMVEAKSDGEKVPLTNSGPLVNFKVSNPETNENVLHYVLQQPLLGKSIQDQYAWKDSNPSARKAEMENEKKAYDYKKCLEVLLDMDKFEDKNGDTRWKCNDPKYYPIQIESIVNGKDKYDNTPLHYAVLNWSEQFVEMLLVLGANASIKNKYNDIPLTRIRKETLENFMNKECIIVKDFDQRDDKIEEDTDDEESYVKKNQAYNQSFMMKIGRCGKEEDNTIKFNYAFLAPPGIKRHECTSSFSSANGDIEGQEYQYKGNLPEMELLWEMGRSEEHRSLIVHPVIDSYLWMKWQLITNYFHRTVRLHFLFLYCITWYLCLHFGGYNWNSAFLWNNGTVVFKEIAVNEKSFCKDLNNEFDDFGLNDETKIGASTVQGSWYYGFVFTFMVQFCLMIRDIISEQFYSTVQNHVVSLWMDFCNIFLSVVIMIFGRKILLVVLTALLLFYLAIEMLEIIATKRSYFKEISNYVDLVMIALIVAVLYVPNSYMSNPKIFSIFDETAEDEKERCGVKRSIAAIVIVLVWTRFLMAFSKLHRLKAYNLYVIIFFKVLQRYVRIMAWYSLYLVAFGIGFYIMLHDDIKKMSRETLSNANRTFQDTKFDNPFLSLMKTSTMFVGEFDFDDIRIRGGDVSTSMAYIFLLVFIFLMVIVLMNVLNGLAVTDTGRMIQESLIESQISIINNIRYFETVYLDLGRMQSCLCCNEKWKIIQIFNVVPKKVFLFMAKPHVKDMELTFPLKVNTTIEEKRATWRGAHYSEKRGNKFIAWLKGGDINFGTEEFLVKAREILVKLRAQKINEKKQEKLLKEIFKMKKCGKNIDGKIQLEDKIKHFENILRLSFSIKSLEDKYYDGIGPTI